MGHRQSRQLGSIAGRLHHKSLSEQYFQQIIFVEGRKQAFVFDAHLLAVIVLQQAQGRARKLLKLASALPLRMRH